MKGDDIAARLLEFAARVLELVSRLPRSDVGKHVARQLTKAATSGGANYEEARGAESRADFAHKVQVSAKEVRESVYWVMLIQRTGLARASTLPWIIREGNELVAILKASARTARERAKAS